jgi:hypothetical protein
MADLDVQRRDQDIKHVAADALSKGAGAAQQAAAAQAAGVTAVPSAVGTAGGKATRGATKPAQLRIPSGARQSAARSSAVTLVALAAAVLALVGSAGPMLHAEAYKDTPGLAGALHDWSPIPQVALLCVVLLLVSVALRQRRQRPDAGTLPSGVRVDASGVLCDEAGVPLARGYKLVGSTIICNASGSALSPSECDLGVRGSPAGQSPHHPCIARLCVRRDRHAPSRAVGLTDPAALLACVAHPPTPPTRAGARPGRCAAAPRVWPPCAPRLQHRPPRRPHLQRRPAPA